MTLRPTLPTSRLTLTVAAGFALALMLMATLTIVGLREMAAINDRLDAIVKVNNVKTRLAGEMRDILRDRAISMLSIVVMSDDFEKDREMMRFYGYGSTYQETRLKLQPMLTLPAEKAVLDRIDAITRENRPIMVEVVELGMQGYTFLAFEVLRQQAIPLQRKLVTELDRLIAIQRDMNQRATEEARAAFGKTRMLMLVLGLAAAGVAALVAMVVVQRTRRLAAAMDRERTKFRTLFETNTDGIVILDEGGFRECNPATLDMFRIDSVEDFLRHRPQDLGAPTQPDGRSAREAAAAGIREAIEQGHALMQWQGRRADGSLFPAEIALHAMTLDGKPYIQAIMRDVTAQKAAEAALQEAHDAAVATTRLKSQFLANVSHEIRTPMNGIIGMTRLLLGTSLDDRQRDYAEAVSRSAESLLAIINDLLDFSKIEAGRLTVEQIPFHLDELLQDVVALQAPRAKAKGLSLVLDKQTEIPDWLLGDPLRVRQILLNLVDNAIKFTQRGQVCITVEPAKLPAGEGYRFTVADTGIGIPPEAQARIFEAFAQADGSTSRRYGGTGLGLAICRQLAELMQGRLSLDSRPDEGSAFHLELPLIPTEPPVEQTESVAELPHFFNTRILVAEDNPVNQKLTRLMLENLGVEVIQAEDGRAAWEMVKQEPLDLVLMDCHMPELDGLQATRAIRAWEEEQGMARLPIVALTANAMPGFEETCRQAGMDGYLLKPLRDESLARTLSHWLPAKIIRTETAPTEASPQAAGQASQETRRAIPSVSSTPAGGGLGAAQPWGPSQETRRAVPSVSSTPAGGGPGAARPWGRSQETGGAVPAVGSPTAGVGPHAAAPSELSFDLDKIRRICRDQTEQVDEMLTLFISSSQPLIEQLRRAAEARQVDQAARHAHQIKGAAAYIGALAMTEAARCAEGAAKAQDWNRLQACLADLEGTFERVRVEMEQRLHALPAG